MSEQETKSRKKWLLLFILFILLLIGIGYCAKSTVASGELARRLSKEGTDTIQLDKDIKVDKALVVHGDKTITGDGRIILVDKLEGTFPSDDSKNQAWGMGCTKLEIEDTDGMAALLNVEDGAALTINGSVKVDAAGKGNAIHVADGGNFSLDGKATIENGRYANIVAGKRAAVEIKGGSVLKAAVYGVVNKGTFHISNGTVSGAVKGAAIYNTGMANQSGGTIEKAGVHNVYVAEGTFKMTGGTIDSSAKDGVVIQKGATAEIEGGKIKNSIHGLCNNGTMKVGAVTLNEAGIMNYKTGVLELTGTKVDTSAVYCLANNGGKVIAKKFTASKCDTCAVYNFSGDMELIDLTVTGSRDGNIANGGGNMTVKGAILEKCRDKSIVVGNGKAVFEDVKVAGTSREKYGVYVYGGELYITNAEVYDISSTAFKVDTGGYIEAKKIDMKDIAQIGFRADGGKVVAEDITMKDLGSHAIYNMDGDITITDAKINTVKKNAIQQRGGNTTLKRVEADNIGNHAAYIALGKVTVSDSAFKNMEGNGFYLIKGENEAVLKNVTLDGVKKQGINNQSKLTINGLTVKNATQNGIFNKENGTVTAKNVEISNVGEHGVNNYNTMTLANAKISKTGKGSNGLQNKGKLTIETVSVTGSKNHGVYNTGAVKGTSLSITDVIKNGVYNNKGTFEVAKVTVNGAGEHGLNNSADMKVSEVTVKNTGAGKNSVQNAGTLSLSKAVLSGSKNHGIYNTGVISGKNIEVKNVAENGVYNAKGRIDAISGLVVNQTGSHGINNEATIQISNVTVTNTGAGKNSIQNGGVAIVSNATLKGSKNHGIYNTGKLSGGSITIESPAGNGVYNTSGTFQATGMTICNTGEHGVSNEADMTISNAVIQETGKAKNGIQNKGLLTITDVKVEDSKNHGIYNAGTVIAKSSLEVTNSQVNAIYNYEGSFEAETITANVTGEHGINNVSTFGVKRAAVTNAGQNSIQNSGKMTVSESAVLKNSGKHGIYNGKEFSGKGIDITNAGDLSLSNGGEMKVYGFVTEGAAHKAIYNSGYAEIYTATIDGAGVANQGAEYLIDNNGGVLDLTDTTVKNAKGTAIHSRSKASTSVTNVIIDKAGNYGTFVEGGSSLSGDGLEINNVYKNAQVSGSEGIPMKNQGKITMLDHVTIGGDDPEVTGSGAAISDTYGDIVNNAVTSDTTTSSYSGYDLVIKNAPASCAIYNKGIIYITDFVADKAKDGIVSRYTGWATLSGNVVLTNTSRNPITTYGPESGSYLNGVELTSGTNLTIDGAQGHAINNKGSFIAAVDTNVVISNVKGTNINAVNNNGGTVVLGNAKISDMFVGISVNSNTNKINTNSGTALMLSGPTTINGRVEISNIYTKPANGSTDNTNGSAVVVRKAGSYIDGTGSISAVSGAAVDGYKSLHNGLFIDGCSVALAGDITIDGASNQGVYVANGGASLKAANVTVSRSGANAFWVNNASGLAVITGTIKTDLPVKGRGVNNSGTITAGNIEVNGVKGYAGIETSKSLTVTGNVTVQNVAGGPGIRNKGAMTVNGITTIQNISGSAGNGLWQENGTFRGKSVVVDMQNAGKYGIYNKASVLNAEDVTVKNTADIGIFMENVSTLKATKVNVDNTANQAIQLNHANTIDVDVMTITNTSKNGLRLYNNSANPSVTVGTFIAKNCKEYGLAAQKALTDSNLHIGKLQYFHCVKNAVHGNIKSGVGVVEELAE